MTFKTAIDEGLAGFVHSVSKELWTGCVNKFSRPAEAGLKSSSFQYPAFRFRSMPGYFHASLRDFRSPDFPTCSALRGSPDLLKLLKVNSFIAVLTYHSVI